MLGSPGQKPNEITSCEYDSRVTGSAPSSGGARRPENRVTARSNECQNSCTGLVLPQNHPENSSSTDAAHETACHQRSTNSRSYERCAVSSANGVVRCATPKGCSRIGTSTPAAASSACSCASNAATERPSSSANESTSPRSVRSTSRW